MDTTETLPVASSSDCKAKGSCSWFAMITPLPLRKALIATNRLRAMLRRLWHNPAMQRIRALGRTSRAVSRIAVLGAAFLSSACGATDELAGPASPGAAQPQDASQSDVGWADVQGLDASPEAAVRCPGGPSDTGRYAATLRDVPAVTPQAPEGPRGVDIAFVPEAGMFCLLYGIATGGQIHTWARNLKASADGLEAGPATALEDLDFPVNGTSMEPSIAVGQSDSLVVFVDDRLGDGNGKLEVFAQFLHPGAVSAAPEKAGGNIDVSQRPETDEHQPGVVYEPVSGKYLVAWSDDRDLATLGPGDYRALFARSIDSGGALGAEFRVGDDALWQINARGVAIDGKVLLAWTDYIVQGAEMLTGVRVRLIDVAASGPAGPILEISRANVFHADPPAIAYNETACNALLVWPDASGPGGMQLTAALLSPTGEIVGASHSLVTAADGAGAPAVAWSRATNSYVLAYHSWATPDASWVEVDAMGNAVGTPRSLHAEVPSLGTFFHPVAASSTAPFGFLVPMDENWATIPATWIEASTD